MRVSLLVFVGILCAGSPYFIHVIGITCYMKCETPPPTLAKATSPADLFTPPPLPSPHYDFSESSHHISIWSQFGHANVLVETPVTYDQTNVNISFLVADLTANESTIVPAGNLATGSRALQAQGFRTSNDTWFAGFSIYCMGNETTQVNMYLLNENFTGETVASYSVDLPSGPGWVNVATSPAPFIPRGHYYLLFIYPGDNGNDNRTSWARNPPNLSKKWDTWAYLGGAWSAQYWNLTLAITTYNVTNPSTVGLRVAGLPVIDTGPGQGAATINQAITGHSLELLVQNDTPVAYSYQCEAVHSNYVTIEGKLSWGENSPNGSILIPSVAPPGGSYSATLSGLQADYYDFRLVGGGANITYARVNPTTIQMTSPPDYLAFSCVNYVTQVDYPQVLIAGRSAEVTVHTLGLGNVSLYIYQNTTLIFSNSTPVDTVAAFSWQSGENLSPGEVVACIYFTSVKEVGTKCIVITIQHSPDLPGWAIWAIVILAGVAGVLLTAMFSHFHTGKRTITGMDAQGRAIDPQLIALSPVPSPFTSEIEFDNVVFFWYGPHGPEIVFMEHPLPDTIAAASGPYFYTAIGQGNQYPTGLFGPLPFGTQARETVALLYATFVTDTGLRDPRLGQRNYFFIALVTTPEKAAVLDRQKLEAKLHRITAAMPNLALLTEKDYAGVARQIRGMPDKPTA